MEPVRECLRVGAEASVVSGKIHHLGLETLGERNSSPVSHLPPRRLADRDDDPGRRGP